MLISGAQKFLMGGFHFIKLESPFKRVNWKQLCYSKGSADSGRGPRAPSPYTLHLTQSAN